MMEKYMQLAAILQERDPFTKTYLFIGTDKETVSISISTLSEDDTTELLKQSRIGECFTFVTKDNTVSIHKVATYKEVEEAKGVRDIVAGKSVFETGIPNVKFWYLVNLEEKARGENND